MSVESTWFRKLQQERARLAALGLSNPGEHPQERLKFARSCEVWINSGSNSQQQQRRSELFTVNEQHTEITELGHDIAQLCTGIITQHHNVDLSSIESLCVLQAWRERRLQECHILNLRAHTSIALLWPVSWHLQGGARICRDIAHACGVRHAEYLSGPHQNSFQQKSIEQQINDTRAFIMMQEPTPQEIRQIEEMLT